MAGIRTPEAFGYEWTLESSRLTTEKSVASRHVSKISETLSVIVSANELSTAVWQCRSCGGFTQAFGRSKSMRPGGTPGIKAVVVSIDSATKRTTLKDAKGQDATLTVTGAAVASMARFKAGDVVIITQENGTAVSRRVGQAGPCLIRGRYVPFRGTFAP